MTIGRLKCLLNLGVFYDGENVKNRKLVSFVVVGEIWGNQKRVVVLGFSIVNSYKIPHKVIKPYHKQKNQ